MTIVTSPFPAYQNFPIEPEFYSPNSFQIQVSAISFGQLTTVTTNIPNQYVVGQRVRFIIPNRYGTTQLNYIQPVVTEILSSTQFICEVDSSAFTTFISSPFNSVITNITLGTTTTITTANSFRPGDLVQLSEISGTTQLNGNSYFILSANSSQIVINVNSTAFTAYVSGGLVEFSTVYQIAQVIAIGDVNSGAINVDNSNQTLYIEGSFRNVSP